MLVNCSRCGKPALSDKLDRRGRCFWCVAEVRDFVFEVLSFLGVLVFLGLVYTVMVEVFGLGVPH